MHILTISGSQRRESINTALLTLLPTLAPEGHSFTQLDYSALPLYNQDLEVSFPEEVTRIKNLIREADAIVISTPEYNRSIPAPLKNLIDWTSRPYGDNAWAGKPVYVTGASVGPTGTALAQADLRKVLMYLDTRVAGQPELYIGLAPQKMTDGVYTDESLIDHVRVSLATFIGFASPKSA